MPLEGNLGVGRRGETARVPMFPDATALYIIAISDNYKYMIVRVGRDRQVSQTSIDPN